MAKRIEWWLLYQFVAGEFTPLSKVFKTKTAAEKARLKLPERERREAAPKGTILELFLAISWQPCH